MVTVTSFAHHFGRAIDPENPYLHGKYEPWKAYNQSKLANFHFGIGLHRLFQARGSWGSESDRAPGDVEHRTAGNQRRSGWRGLGVIGSGTRWRMRTRDVTGTGCASRNCAPQLIRALVAASSTGRVTSRSVHRPDVRSCGDRIGRRDPSAVGGL